MAIIDEISIPDLPRRTTRGWQWLGLTASDTGRPISVGDFEEKSVQIVGTGITGAVTFEGTNDPNQGTWNTLNDSQGTAISVTTNSLMDVQENTLFVRPAVAAGGTPNIDIFLFVKRKD